MSLYLSVQTFVVLLPFRSQSLPPRPLCHNGRTESSHFLNIVLSITCLQFPRFWTIVIRGGGLDAVVEVWELGGVRFICHRVTFLVSFFHHSSFYLLLPCTGGAGVGLTLHVCGHNELIFPVLRAACLRSVPTVVTKVCRHIRGVLDSHW